MEHPRITARHIGLVKHPDSRGSCYRVADSLALTAAHVVAAAGSFTVCFNPGGTHETHVEASVLWRDPTTDLALLTFEPFGTDGEERYPDLGRLPEAGGPFTCSFVGYPYFMLRADPTLAQLGASGTVRDTWQSFGRVTPLSGRRLGTLEISVTDPHPSPESSEAKSPWAGASGAAVFVGGALVGVLTGHRRGQGGHEHLTGSRLTALEPSAAVQFTDLLQKAGRADVDLARLPVARAVRPYQDRYRALATDLTPHESAEDRSEELAALAEFCAGQEPCLLVTGGAFSGKTGLLATFAVNPPPATEIVSHFVRRVEGQRDRNDFLAAMCRQLAEIVGDPAIAASGGLADFLDLLQRAGAAVETEHGPEARLVLLIDGLDEDEGVEQPGQETIAAALPLRLPRNVRAILSSRPNPNVLSRLNHDHLLRTAPTLGLQATPGIRALEGSARLELDDLIERGPLARDALWLLALCNNLTRSELEELTDTSPPGAPPADATARGTRAVALDGLLQRSRVVETLRLPARFGESDAVYTLAHGTYRENLIQRLPEGNLTDLTGRVDTWAGRYRDQGWPSSTPAFLLRSYGEFLRVHGSAVTLATVTSDPVRHDLMVARSASEAPAVAEVALAEKHLATQTDTDLGSVLALAAERDRLATRTRAMPWQLAGAWARAAQVDRALAIAESVQNPRSGALAYCAVADVLSASNPQRAELINVARRTYEQVGPDGERARLAAALSITVAKAEGSDAHCLAAQAVEAACQIANPLDRANCLADVARLDHAGMVIAQVTTAVEKLASPYERALAAAFVAFAMAPIDPRQAAHFVTTARAAAEILTGQDEYAEIAQASAALALYGCDAAAAPPQHRLKCWLLLAAVAKDSLRHTPESPAPTEPNTEVARQAGRLAAIVGRSYSHRQQFAAIPIQLAASAVLDKWAGLIAESIACEGEAGQARAAFEAFGNRMSRRITRNRIVEVWVRRGLFDEAIELADSCRFPDEAVETLAVAAAAAAERYPARSRDLALEAERRVRTQVRAGFVDTVAALGEALATADPSASRTAAAFALDHANHDTVRAAVVRTGARLGDNAMIESALQAMSGQGRYTAEIEVAALALSSGHLEFARARARHCGQGVPRDKLMSSTARMLAKLGDWSAARDCLLDVTDGFGRLEAAGRAVLDAERAGHRAAALELARLSVEWVPAREPSARLGQDDPSGLAAHHLAEAGFVREALQLAQADNRERRVSLAYLGVIEGAPGPCDEADLAAEALAVSLADRAGSPWALNTAELRGIEVLAAENHPALVTGIVRKCRTPESRIHALISIARALVRFAPPAGIEMMRAAHKLWASVDWTQCDHDGLIAAFRKVAAERETAGDHDGARELNQRAGREHAGRLKNAVDDARFTLRAVALGYIAVGYPEEGLELSAQLEKASDRDTVVTAAARHLARHGDLDRAGEVLSLIENRYETTDARFTVTMACVERLLDSRGLAARQAEENLMDSARELVRRMADNRPSVNGVERHILPILKALLEGINGAATVPGEQTELLRRCITRISALTARLDGWQKILVTLAQVDPAAVTRLGNDLLAGAAN